MTLSAFAFLKDSWKDSLVKSKFVNLKIRQLSAETSHDFIEWCGLIDDQEREIVLEPGIRLYKNDLYDNFVREYPDYGAHSRMTMSRTKFYKWITSYAVFKHGVSPEEGRDARGRWVIIRTKSEVND